MATRSLRHRSTRRRRVPVRPAAGAWLPQVEIELTDVKGIRQAAVIQPGFDYALSLNGYIDGFGGMKRVVLPVVVRARII